MMNESKFVPIVLVVDDTPENIDILSGILKDDYKIKAALDGEKALRIAAGPNPPDLILLKNGSLTNEEFEVMKTHTILGGDALSKAEKAFGDIASTTFLRVGKEIAYSHHERWDGTGYPYGLKGTEIPLSARLMALADVYDALISKRVYKSPFSHEKAVTIITAGDDRVMPDHFDPDVLKVFIDHHEEFRRIALQYADPEKHFQHAQS